MTTTTLLILALVCVFVALLVIWPRPKKLQEPEVVAAVDEAPYKIEPTFTQTDYTAQVADQVEEQLAEAPVEEQIAEAPSIIIETPQVIIAERAVEEKSEVKKPQAPRQPAAKKPAPKAPVTAKKKPAAKKPAPKAPAQPASKKKSAKKPAVK